MDDPQWYTVSENEPYKYDIYNIMSHICGARKLSGRMPDSQSSEPGFESLFVTVSKIGHVRSLH